MEEVLQWRQVILETLFLYYKEKCLFYENEYESQLFHISWQILADTSTRVIRASGLTVGKMLSNVMQVY